MCEATEVLRCYGGPMHGRDVEIRSGYSLTLSAGGRQDVRYVPTELPLMSAGGCEYSRMVLLCDSHPLTEAEKEDVKRDLLAEARRFCGVTE